MALSGGVVGSFPWEPVDAVPLGAVGEEGAVMPFTRMRLVQRLDAYCTRAPMMVRGYSHFYAVGCVGMVVVGAASIAFLLLLLSSWCCLLRQIVVSCHGDGWRRGWHIRV